jgi:hypothetical protein
MRSATPRIVLIPALAGAVSAYTPSSAGATATGERAVPVPAYAWPAEAGPEPREEEWAGATALETAMVKDSAGVLLLACGQQALGGWLRITCTAPEPRRLGAVWGLAGDTAKVKGKFSLLSELERYKKAPTSVQEDMERKMGGSATITLPVTPGSAALLRLDSISWEEEWDWSGVVASPWLFIDVSWALGETHPTILYR